MRHPSDVETSELLSRAAYVLASDAACGPRLKYAVRYLCDTIADLRDATGQLAAALAASACAGPREPLNRAAGTTNPLHTSTDTREFP